MVVVVVMVCICVWVGGVGEVGRIYYIRRYGTSYASMFWHRGMCDVPGWILRPAVVKHIHKALPCTKYPFDDISRHHAVNLLICACMGVRGVTDSDGP